MNITAFGSLDNAQACAALGRLWSGHHKVQMDSKTRGWAETWKRTDRGDTLWGKLGGASV